MSALHTPGPWYVSTVNGSVGAKIGRFTIFIADVWSTVGRPVGEAAANARLIAAAPDLLEVLQRMPVDVEFANAELFRVAVNTWWDGDVAPAIARATPSIARKDG